MNKRPEEITNDFLKIMDNNLKELIDGKTGDYLDIHKIAEMLFIHPTHLSNTIKDVTGKSPCDICNDKTIAVAKKMLDNPSLTISEIAFKLTYEPTNFTKYFKKFAGETPSQYRKSVNQ
ncbi:MAG: AraC family transcriptional regulator [Crocinitomicaceae bacterium]